MEENEIDLMNYLNVIKRKFYLIIISVAIALGIGINKVINLADVYATTAVVQTGIVGGTLFMPNQIPIIINSVDIMGAVKDRFNEKYKAEYTLQEFKDFVTIEIISDFYFRIQVRGTDPVRITDIAKMLIEQYSEYSEGRFAIATSILNERISINEEALKNSNSSIKELKKEVIAFAKEKKFTPEPIYKSILLNNVYAQHMKEYYDLQEKKINLKSQLLSIVNFRVLEPPEVPKRPYYENKKKIIFKHFWLAVFIGIVLAFVVDYFQNIYNRSRSI
ncbi:MAG: hypothetical protein ABII27_08050 [bacterium]